MARSKPGHRHALLGEVEAAVQDGGLDPLASLPDCTIAQTDDRERWKACADVDLDLDAAGTDPADCERDDTGEHAAEATPASVTRGDLICAEIAQPPCVF
jgi:hypothetical protein